MIRTFVRLKLRLLRNGLRSSNSKFALVVFGGLGLMILVGVVIAQVAMRGQPENVGPILTVVFGAIVLLWIVGPLLAGMTDGTVDPSRLAHLPVGGARLVASLTAAAAAGLVPAFFTVGMLLFLGTARSLAELAFALVAIVLLILLCVIVAQVGAASMSGMLRGRKTRDVAAAILALLAMSGGLLAQFGLDAVFEASIEQVRSVARWLRWTPGGWVGQSIAWSREGRWLPAIGALGAVAGFIGLAGALWWSLLKKLLTSAEDLGGASIGTGVLVPRWLRLLPGGEPVQVATARALKYIRRDPREWSGIAAQLPLLLIVGFPVASIESEQVVLLVGGTGVYGGMLNSNLFGIDGRSIWVDQLAAASMRPVLWGKTIAHAIIVVPLLAIMVLLMALWKGGWIYLIPGAGLAVATFGCITGALAVGSVRFALPLPEGVNPFAGQGTGANASQGLMLMVSLLIGFVVALPAVAVVGGAALVNGWLGIALTPLAVAYGFWLWRRGVHAAGREAEADGPNLLARLTLPG